LNGSAANIARSLRAFALRCSAYLAAGVAAAKLQRDPRLRAHLLQRAKEPIPETIRERLRVAARDDVRRMDTEWLRRKAALEFRGSQWN
jgi:hypothetical protein